MIAATAGRRQAHSNSRYLGILNRCPLSFPQRTEIHHALSSGTEVYDTPVPPPKEDWRDCYWYVVNRLAELGMYYARLFGFCEKAGTLMDRSRNDTVWQLLPRGSKPSPRLMLSAHRPCVLSFVEDGIRLMSKWSVNGGPSHCVGCGNSFPRREKRIEAQVGNDGKLYCYGGTCERDALDARAAEKRRAS